MRSETLLILCLSLPVAGSVPTTMASAGASASARKAKFHSRLGTASSVTHLRVSAGGEIASVPTELPIQGIE